MKFIYAVIAGFILDLIFGDPQYVFHPIRFIGKLIEWSENFTRKICHKSKNGEILAGGITVIIVTSVTFATVFSIVHFSYKLNKYLGFIVESIICYFALATKSLKTESMKVYYPLEKGNINEARQAVSMIVGRDTENLNGSEIAKAAVETVAENTSDGVIAPLFYMCLGGTPLGFLYKAFNTMDSMIAYKNDKYLNFGKIAAKCDDIVNFIPARLSAFLMIAAAFLIKLDARNAYKIFKRDRFNHASPNSAQTESVCAGALNIRLAGDAFYFGILHKKQTIGDKNREISYKDIVIVNNLMYTTAIIGLIVFSVLNFILF